MNKTIKSLYVINKKAKQYKNSNSINSLRYKYLYKLKYSILDKLKNKTDKVELHYINNKKYYCFYFNDYNNSFHIPKNKSLRNYSIDGTTSFNNFVSTNKNKLDLTEREALIYLNEEYNENINTYIPENNTVLYWKYLPIT